MVARGSGPSRAFFSKIGESQAGLVVHSCTLGRHSVTTAKSQIAKVSGTWTAPALHTLRDLTPRRAPSVRIGRHPRRRPRERHARHRRERDALAPHSRSRRRPPPSTASCAPVAASPPLFAPPRPRAVAASSPGESPPGESPPPRVIASPPGESPPPRKPSYPPPAIGAALDTCPRKSVTLASSRPAGSASSAVSRCCAACDWSAARTTARASRRRAG